MKSRYRVLVAIVVVVAACGGDGSDTENPTLPTTSSDRQSGDGDTGTVLDPNFDISSVPDDFPAQLMPDSFTAGMYGELGEVRNVNFETSSSFDEVVAEYTAKLGEPIAIVGEDDRLASWVIDDKWNVTVIESETAATLIGISTAG